MGCQVDTCFFGPTGGGSGVSIGGVRILRVFCIIQNIKEYEHWYSNPSWVTPRFLICPTLKKCKFWSDTHTRRLLIKGPIICFFWCVIFSLFPKFDYPKTSPTVHTNRNWRQRLASEVHATLCWVTCQSSSHQVLLCPPVTGCFISWNSDTPGFGRQKTWEKTTTWYMSLSLIWCSWFFCSIGFFSPHIQVKMCCVCGPSCFMIYPRTHRSLPLLGSADFILFISCQKHKRGIRAIQVPVRGKCFDDLLKCCCFFGRLSNFGLTWSQMASSYASSSQTQTRSF